MSTQLSIQLSPQASGELIQPHADVNASAEIHQNGGCLSPQIFTGIIQSHQLQSTILEGEVNCSRLPTRMSIQLSPQASTSLAEIMVPTALPEYPPPYHRMSRMSVQMSPQALTELLQQPSSSEMPPAYSSLYPALYATKASTEPYIVSLEYPPDNEPLPCTSFPRFSNDMGAYPGPPFYIVTLENDYELTPPGSVSGSPFTMPAPKQQKLCTTLRTHRSLAICIPLILLVVSIFITLTIVFTRHHTT